MAFRRKVQDVLSIGNQTGEGWFLTAEMIEYIENDIPNIVCVQPFACLPNHVVGKGVIKTIRNKFLRLIFLLLIMTKPWLQDNLKRKD